MRQFPQTALPFPLLFDLGTSGVPAWCNDDQKLSPSPGLVNLSPVVKRRHGDLDRHDFLRAISVGHGYVVDAGLPDSRTGLQSVHAVFQLSSDFERNF